MNRQSEQSIKYQYHAHCNTIQKTLNGDRMRVEKTPSAIHSINEKNMDRILHITVKSMPVYIQSDYQSKDLFIYRKSKLLE